MSSIWIFPCTSLSPLKIEFSLCCCEFGHRVLFITFSFSPFFACFLFLLLNSGEAANGLPMVTLRFGMLDIFSLFFRFGLACHFLLTFLFHFVYKARRAMITVTALPTRPTVARSRPIMRRNPCINGLYVPVCMFMSTAFMF